MASNTPPPYSSARSLNDSDPADTAVAPTTDGNLDELDESILNLPDRESGYGGSSDSTEPAAAAKPPASASVSQAATPRQTPQSSSKTAAQTPSAVQTSTDTEPENPGPSDKVRSVLHQLQKSLAQVVQTDADNLRLVLVNLLCRGHLLLEDAPGLGKTTLARTLSQSLALRMKRVQCTPDLMPSDITGISVYNSEEHKFHFMPGPVFSNILLADEINRATPRTQSALLEAMAEGTVSVDRKTYNLPKPFMVIATQNPVEFSGTFPLPEAQLDRFFMRLSLGYPNDKQEVALMLAQLSGHPLDKVKPVLNEQSLLALQSQVEKITLSEPVVEYISQLVRATRKQPGVRLGASPRGSLALMQAARAMALLKGEGAVTPALIPALLEPILGHRLIWRDASLQHEEERQQFWKKLLASVPLPDFPQGEA